MSEDAGEQESQKPTHRRWWPLALAAVALVAVVIAVWLASRPYGGADTETDGTADDPTTAAASVAAADATEPGDAETPADDASSDTARDDATDPSSPGASEPPEPDDRFPEQEPVAPTAEAVGAQATVTLASIEATEGEPRPGEVAGPAVQVTVLVENTGDADLDLDLVAVTASYGSARTPAEGFEGQSEPVSGSLTPGETGQGTYLFRVPLDQRSEVTVVVDYLPGEPAAVFQGQIG